MARRAAVRTKRGEKWQGKEEQDSSEPRRRRAGGINPANARARERRRSDVLASVV